MRVVTRAVLAGVGVVLAVSLYVILQSGNGYLVRAEFRNADGLRSGFYVEIGALQAGTIEKVSVNRQGLAVVTMRLNKGAYPIGSGASATIRPVNLLGEKYIDLTAGNIARPQPSGVVIPVSRTDASVDLDQILDMVDPTTAARLRILINEVGVALSGRGSDFNALLGALPGSLHQLGTMIDGFAADNLRLRSLIDNGNQVVSAVSGKRGDLQRLVTNTEQTLRVLASRRSQLAATVTAGAPGLQQLDRTLVRLQAVAADLRPAAVDIHQSAPYLATTLRMLPGFQADARPALSELRRSAPFIERLSALGTPTVRSLAPTLANLNRFAGLLAPTMNTLAAQGAWENLLRFANNWTGLTDLSDGLGHVFRVRLVLDPATLGLTTSQPLIRRPARSSAPGQSRPVACAAHCGSAPTGSGTRAPASPPPKQNAPLYGLPAAVTGAVTGALNPGQTASTVSSLLHYLLGR